MNADDLRPWRPTAGAPWDRSAVAHLWRRAGFGATPSELERALEEGPQQSLQRLLEPSGHSAALVEGVRAVLAVDSLEGLQSWWTELILMGGDPLGERLTLFWHDHFATSNDKVADVRAMHAQVELLRERGGGDFRELLHAVARDPAMLIWLDGDENRVGHPNENFAREVLELFALGIGHYSEDDVLEAARAFTGWGTRGRAFAWRPELHDGGVKRVLGARGAFDGDAVLDVILASPDCARHVARALLAEFVVAGYDEGHVGALADVLIERGWSVRSTLEVLLASRLFFAPETRHARIAGPVELCAITLRGLDARVPARDVVRACARMGQSLYRPPSVKGWDGGRAWIHAGTWLARHDLLAGLVLESSRVDLEACFGTPRPVERFVERLCDSLLLRDPGPAFREAVTSAVDAAPDDDTALARGAALVLTSPEYQLV
ncbi:MAG TPA: DUF1800 domain-containing protein [Planctomycetota bacterium]|nr:DUF1800 domain-containing protein [Planctomycetota bacterium]